MIFLRDCFCLSVVSGISRQRHDILDFSCRPLSLVLHVTLADLEKFGFEFHLRSSSAFSGMDDQSIHTLLLATPCWQNSTLRSKQLSTVAILGFQFGLYHVAVPLSFLRSISHASFLSIISMRSNVSVKSKLQHPPPGHTPGIWRLFLPGRREFD